MCSLFCVKDQSESLQDAFATKRPDFVRKSEQRLVNAKEKAKKSSEKRIEELGHTIASWKKTRGLNVKPGQHSYLVLVRLLFSLISDKSCFLP